MNFKVAAAPPTEIPAADLLAAVAPRIRHLKEGTPEQKVCAMSALSKVAAYPKIRALIGETPGAIDALVALLSPTQHHQISLAASITLTNLAHDTDNQTQICKTANALEYIVAQLPPTNPLHNQQFAANALKVLALENPATQTQICKTPHALEYLVAQLLRPEDATQQTAAKALANLAGNDESRGLIGQTKDAIQNLAQLLEPNHPLLGKPTHPFVQAAAILALRELACIAPNRVLIRDTPGAIDALVKLFKTSAPDSEIKQSAAIALGNLAYLPANQALIGKADGVIDALGEALQSPILKLQLVAAEALAALACDRNNQDTLGAHPTIINDLIARLRIPTPELLDPEERQRVALQIAELQIAAANALGNLASDHDVNKNHIGQNTDAIRDLVPLLEKHDPLLDEAITLVVQRAAAAALGNLGVNHRGNIDKIQGIKGADENLCRIHSEKAAATQSKAAA